MSRILLFCSTVLQIVLMTLCSRNQDRHCCDKSANRQCRIACREILKTHVTSPTAGEEVISSLERSGCGPPLPYDQMWQCFLLNSMDMQQPSLPVLFTGAPTETEFLRMDSGKLQCCFKAKTAVCQNLCIKTFTNEWSLAWGDFDRFCQYNFVESAMLQCLAEVDEPCKLGCDGLTFCSVFNFRPLEFFRSCNTEADVAAQLDLTQWMQEGVLRLPMLDIPVLNLSSCHPKTWKVIACLLHIKPCRQRVHINRICKTDCVDILSQCTDQKRLPGDYTPETLCELLSPPGSNLPCIPLSEFIERKPGVILKSDVTSPCKLNQCQEHEICVVNRDCSVSQFSKKLCKYYMCLPGCRLGDTSNLIVSQNSILSIRQSLQGARCHMICQCSSKGILQNCIARACASNRTCQINSTKIAHDTAFVVDCNHCYCYSGEISCTTKICVPTSDKMSERLCNCPNHYVPVCSLNGKTYPSACVARCMGLSDKQFDFGACHTINPCEPNPCSQDRICIVKLRTCLTTNHIFCQQFECVSKKNCQAMVNSSVCSNNRLDFSNACWMFKDNESLAHHGKCLGGCSLNGVVCGLNGEQYNSECEALATHTAIDYVGGCRGYSSKGELCEGVACKELPSKHCIVLRPTGACCPVCGGGIIQAVYSKTMLEHFLLPLRRVEAVSVQTLAKTVKLHLMVLECDISVQMTVDQRLEVVVSVRSQKPTQLQANACAFEAERLAKLMDLRSPTIITEMPMSAVVGALTLEYNIKSNTVRCVVVNLLTKIVITIIGFNSLNSL